MLYCLCEIYYEDKRHLYRGAGDGNTVSEKREGKVADPPEGAEDEILQEAEEVASHDDVQQFMAGVQQDYAGAVASDAMLAEVLTVWNRPPHGREVKK